MTEKGFVRELMNELEGKVPERVREENARIYHDYFEGKRAEGISDEEILKEVGSVEEIVKTIVEMSKEENYYHSSREAGLLDGQTLKTQKREYRTRKRKEQKRSFLSELIKKLKDIR